MLNKYKKKFIIGSFVMVVMIFSGINAAKASGEELKVLSPKAGAKWKVGQTKSIKWKSKNIDKVAIYIYDGRIEGSGSTNYITPNAKKITASKKSYAWQINLNQLPGNNLDRKMNKFKIRIDGFDKDGYEVISKWSKGKFEISK